MNRDEFARFFQQRLYLRFTTDFGIDDQLQPECSFIRFPFYDANLGDEFSP